MPKPSNSPVFLYLRSTVHLFSNMGDTNLLAFQLIYYDSMQIVITWTLQFRYIVPGQHMGNIKNETRKQGFDIHGQQ